MSERTVGAAEHRSVAAEPSASEAETVSERSERTVGAAEHRSVAAEPSASEAET
ncbi:hypothetical protein AB4305_11700 [Nocardia sp. 2YAB30]|uniref:hypothetical protein n=1 Tax=unclassified Nocardia TaxID=2637762 RepID=UPI003F9539BA